MTILTTCTALTRRFRTRLADESGMSTIEYALGSVAAAALAAVLYGVINASAVVDAIEGIITGALSNTP